MKLVYSTTVSEVTSLAKDRKICGACRKIKKKCICGRKLFDGKDINVVLSKLETAFGLGSTDKEACYHADISVPALQRYFDKYSEFRERTNLLKERGMLFAKSVIFRLLQRRK